MTDAVAVAPAVAPAVVGGERTGRPWFGLRRFQRGPLGLRRRILLTFTLGSMMLSAFLAFTTYGLARNNIVEQRDNNSLDTAFRNAQVVQQNLRGDPSDAGPALDALAAIDVQRPVIRYRDRWAGRNTRYDWTAIPPELVSRVLEDARASRMITYVNGEPNIVVGIPLPAVGAYFEFFSLDEVDRTLSSVRLSLLLAGLITTGLGVLLGIFAARRAVRPVAVAAQAAKAIAGGRLDTRLEPTDDPDLSTLANSFNDMAAALQARVERDARFASDVSHELRSPLMTLAASVEVMQARREDMPERAQAALDLLVSDVARFQGLVEDLLEISRFDAGAIRLHLEELLLVEFVAQAVAVSSAPTTPVHIAPEAEELVIRGDRRRLARVVANLLDNANFHGGGGPEITITAGDDGDGKVSYVLIAVEDHGPGVPEDERDLVFERFARGGSAGRRAASDGAGLGLALVDEHVRMHGGRVWVENRHDGVPGARFVIELPAEEIDE